MGGFPTFTKHLPQKLDSFGNWFQTVSKSKLVQHASLQVSRARAVVWWILCLRGSVVPGLLAPSGFSDAASYENVLFVLSSCVLRQVVQHLLPLPAFAYPFGVASSGHRLLQK